MPIESTGAVSLGTSAGTGRSISGEFGGTAPHSLSEYKSGGGLVPSGITGIPTTNSNIKMSLFQGTSNLNYGNFVVSQGYADPSIYTQAGKGVYYDANGAAFYYGSISPNNLNGNGFIHFSFIKGVFIKTAFNLMRLEIEGEHAKDYISGITGPFGSGGAAATLSTSILETVSAVAVPLLTTPGHQVDGGTTKWYWIVPSNIGPQRTNGILYPQAGDGPWDGSGNINVTINA